MKMHISPAWLHACVSAHNGMGGHNTRRVWG